MAMLAALILSASPASAQDRLIDVMTPEGVARVMRAEGFKADIKKRDGGQMYIDAERDGWTFNVEFYDCNLVTGCTSLQFFSWYKREPHYTLERINLWNTSKRFLKVAIDKDNDLAATMDVSLVGKTTYANFADTIDWWWVTLTNLFDFLDEKPEAKADPPPKP